MKLKRSTQGLLLAALLLGTGVAVYEGTIVPERQVQQEREDNVLEIETADIQAIELETPDRKLRFERLEEPMQFELTEEEGALAIADWEFVRLDEPEPAEPPKPAEAEVDGNEDEPNSEEPDSEEPDLNTPEADGIDDAGEEASPDSEPSDEVDAETSPIEDETDTEEAASAEDTTETDVPASEESVESEESVADVEVLPDSEEPPEEGADETASSNESDGTDDAEKTEEPEKPIEVAKDYSEPTPTRQAYIDYLFGAIERAESERTIASPAENLADYGLESPKLRATLELADGTQHTIELGDRDFTQNFVYATIDRGEEAEEVEVLLLSPDFINAIDREIEDWDATIAIDSGLTLPEPELDEDIEESDESDTSDPDETEPDKPESETPTDEVPTDDE